MRKSKELHVQKTLQNLTIMPNGTSCGNGKNRQTKSSRNTV